MLEIKYDNGKFLAKGTFSVGIAGVYENKTFDDDTITIDIDPDELLEDLQRKSPYKFEALYPYLADKDTDGASLAKGLEKYFNHKEDEIRKNIKQINDCILYYIFDDLEGCGFPFWEIEEAVVPEWFEDNEEDDEEIYPATFEEGIDYWGKSFYELPSNSTIEKPDVEGRLRKQYPMFNFDGLYQTMIPDSVFLSDSNISIQFSDGWDACMLECAYLSFDENFAPLDWHNH